MLRRVELEDVINRRRTAVDRATFEEAQKIVDDVRRRGMAAVEEYANSFGEIVDGESLVLRPPELARAFDGIEQEERELLERTASRIRTFADAQRASVRDVTIDLPGGQAGHTILPVDRAGCYAPGGRAPLPSSVLMTAVTARAAGVREVWAASPRPAPATLAAAAVAGVDGFLAAGGVHAIAALAYGAGQVPACDIVAGPGNKWVTAAKRVVAGDVGIDMLAGPSELLVLADDSADPATVAADLLAQAEHDPEALPILVSLDAGLMDRVEAELRAQLPGLPSAATARQALANGFAVLASNHDEAVAVCNAIAPEHLEVMVCNGDRLVDELRHAGALFLDNAAEVLGDYGAGPNHVLPTGGTARFSAGLSVFIFLRARTWLRLTDLRSAQPLVRDAISLARAEGLEAHARAAQRRTRH